MDPATLIAAAAQQMATTANMLGDISRRLAEAATPPPQQPTPPPQPAMPVTRITLEALARLLTQQQNQVLPQLYVHSETLSNLHASSPVPGQHQSFQFDPRQHQSCQFDPQFGPAPQVSATTPQFSPATPQVSSPVAADIEEGEVLPQGASMSRETLLEWLKSSIDWLTLGDRTPARETALAAANRLHELAVWPDADVAGIEKMARKYNLIDDALGGPPPPPPGTPPSPAEAAKEGMRVMHIQQRRAEASNPSVRRLNESHGLGGWGSENNVLRTLITEKGGTGGDLPKSG